MDIVVETQILVMFSMAIVIGLKTFGFYYAKKLQNPEITFDPRYAVTAFFALFTAYAAYRSHITIGTPIDVFIDAGIYAIAFNLAFDIPGKFNNAN